MGTLQDSVWGRAGDADNPLLVVELLSTDGSPRLMVTGELCVASGDVLETAIERFRAEIGGEVAVDLSGVSFMDAAGLSAVVRGFKRAGEGAELRLVAVSTPVQRIVELTSTEWLLDGDDRVG